MILIKENSLLTICFILFDFKILKYSSQNNNVIEENFALKIISKPLNKRDKLDSYL